MTRKTMIGDPFSHFLCGLAKGWRDPGVYIKNRGLSIETSHTGAKIEPRSFQEESHDITMTKKS